MSSITIIGTGLAGYNLAKEIRKLDKDVSITMVTADDGESYSKPMLSNALSKGKSADQLILSDAQKMQLQLNAIIHTRTVVEAIDTDHHLLKTSKGEIVFDKLVLAVGASQRTLPIKGSGAQSILSVNDLDDYRAFQEHLLAANTVAIIGAGLIGCEFANDLLAINKKVIIIGSSKTPLDRLLLPEIGEQLKERFQSQGVHWQLGVTAQSVEISNVPDHKYTITLSDGHKLDADLVFSAVGLIPNTKLAEQAGIVVNRGIVVNKILETSVNGIYALGDCMEINGLLLPYVLPIMNCARALAKTLSGEQTEIKYPAMPVVVKTPSYPIVVSPPAENVHGNWQLEIDAHGARALFTSSDNQLQGFVLTDQKISEKQSLTKQLPAVLD